jgi:hypothetical protein
MRSRRRKAVYRSRTIDITSCAVIEKILAHLRLQARAPPHSLPVASRSKRPDAT